METACPLNRSIWRVSRHIDSTAVRARQGVEQHNKSALAKIGGRNHLTQGMRELVGNGINKMSRAPLSDSCFVPHGGPCLLRSGNRKRRQEKTKSLSVSVSVSVCLSLCPSVPLSACLSGLVWSGLVRSGLVWSGQVRSGQVCLSVCLSVLLSGCLSVCLFVWPA